MKRVLITGASGFLGQAVIKKLSQCDEVEAVAVVSGRKEVCFASNILVEKANLLNPDACKQLIIKTKPDCICHLAWGQEEEDFRHSHTNLAWLEASVRLLDIFATCGGKRFLFAGSSTEYDDKTGKLSETNRVVPMTLYGACKKSFAQIMKSYCQIEKIQYVDMRFFTIYGEGDSHSFGAIPQTINHFLRGESVICKSPQNIRDYIYVDDAADVVKTLIENNFCGSVNIGSGHPKMMRNVFEEIAKEMHAESLLQFADNVYCDMIHVADTTEMDKFVDRSQWMPFERGLSQTISWWKNRQAVSDERH